MNEQTIITLLFVTGAMSSVLLPYLRNWLSSGEAFDWRMVVGQILATTSTVFSQIIGIVDVLGDATRVQAFFLGWGISSVGRFAQKGYDAAKDRLNGGS